MSHETAVGSRTQTTRPGEIPRPIPTGESGPSNILYGVSPLSKASRDDEEFVSSKTRAQRHSQHDQSRSRSRANDFRKRSRLSKEDEGHYQTGEPGDEARCNRGSRPLTRVGCAAWLWKYANQEPCQRQQSHHRQIPRPIATIRRSFRRHTSLRTHKQWLLHLTASIHNLDAGTQNYARITRRLIEGESDEGVKCDVAMPRPLIVTESVWSIPQARR